MKNIGLKIMIAALALGLAGGAMAKLPAPSEEAKAKAEEAKAKTAWGDKVAAYKLCLAMNAVAEKYTKEQKVKGAAVTPPTETPACADPGPFVAPGAAPAAAAAPAAPAQAAAATPPKPAAPAAAAAPGKK